MAIIIIVVVGCGGTCLACNGTGPLFALLAVFMLLFALLMGAVWIDNHSGLSAFMDQALVFVTGVPDAGDVVVTDCPSGVDTTETLGFWVVPQLILILGGGLVNGLVVLGAIAAGTCFVVGLAVSPVVTLVSRDGAWVAGVGMCLIAFLLLLLAAGLLMRGLHFLSLLGC